MLLQIKKVDSFTITSELSNKRIGYKGKLKNGDFFVILEGGDYQFPQSLQVFIGKEELKEVEVTYGQHHVDCGRPKTIRTEKGNFFFPSPLENAKTNPPLFGGEEIEML
jgi:hypothetical protein